MFILKKKQGSIKFTPEKIMPNRNLVKPVVANCWRCADPAIFAHLDEFCLTHQMGTLYLYFYTDKFVPLIKMLPSRIFFIIPCSGGGNPYGCLVYGP